MENTQDKKLYSKKRIKSTLFVSLSFLSLLMMMKEDEKIYITKTYIYKRHEKHN
jgi:hypothetical protein